MTESQFRKIKVGDKLRHKGGHVVTVEHRNEDPSCGIDLPVFCADCCGGLAVVTRPDLWDKATRAEAELAHREKVAAVFLKRMSL